LTGWAFDVLLDATSESIAMLATRIPAARIRQVLVTGARRYLYSRLSQCGMMDDASSKLDGTVAITVAATQLQAHMSPRGRHSP
jgi:hypothetical protein